MYRFSGFGLLRPESASTGSDHKNNKTGRAGGYGQTIACPYCMLRNIASGPEIGLPGWISAGFLSGDIKIGPAAGRRSDGGQNLKLSRLESVRNPAWKPDFRNGGAIP